MQDYTLYATFGSGQPYYPGHIVVTVTASSALNARVLAQAALTEKYGRKWCALYSNRDDLFSGDRNFRGNLEAKQQQAAVAPS